MSSSPAWGELIFKTHAYHYFWSKMQPVWLNDCVSPSDPQTSLQSGLVWLPGWAEWGRFNSTEFLGMWGMVVSLGLVTTLGTFSGCYFLFRPQSSFLFRSWTPLLTSNKSKAGNPEHSFFPLFFVIRPLTHMMIGNDVVFQDEFLEACVWVIFIPH